MGAATKSIVRTHSKTKPRLVKCMDASGTLRSNQLHGTKGKTLPAPGQGNPETTCIGKAKESTGTMPNVRHLLWSAQGPNQIMVERMLHFLIRAISSAQKRSLFSTPPSRVCEPGRNFALRRRHWHSGRQA